MASNRVQEISAYFRPLIISLASSVASTLGAFIPCYLNAYPTGSVGCIGVLAFSAIQFYWAVADGVTAQSRNTVLSADYKPHRGRAIGPYASILVAGQLI